MGVILGVVNVILRNFCYDWEAPLRPQMIEYAWEEMDPMLC